MADKPQAMPETALTRALRTNRTRLRNAYDRMQSEGTDLLMLASSAIIVADALCQIEERIRVLERQARNRP